MAASVRWNEYNGAGATETTGITNVNAGSVDSPNLDPAANPVKVGEHAYDKWHKIDFFGGTFNKVSNFKFWRSDSGGGDGASLPTGITVKGEVGTPGGGDLTFSQPATSAIAASDVPNTEAGALSVGPSELTATGKSHYIHTQVQSTGSAPTGETQFWYTFRYDEE